MSSSAIEYFTTMLNKESAMLFPRASTGLYALLSAIGKKYGFGEIVLPSLCCETVALAILYSGHSIKFADVTKETFTINNKTLTPLISDKTRAVIVVHLFGIDAQVEQFAAIRKNNPTIVFIEDIAHAVGGKDSNQNYLGSQLDYTLMSFAEDKILPGNVGIILIPKNALVSYQQLFEFKPNNIPKPPEELNLSLRNLVHSMADLWRIKPNLDIANSLRTTFNHYKELIIYSNETYNEKDLNLAIENMKDLRLKRVERARFYKNNITNASVKTVHGYDTCWRYPILLKSPDLTVSLTKKLRKANINASNHYFPLHILIGGESCPEAENISRKIINLWVDDTINEQTLITTVDIINSL
jgi:dTDP-4-amino-4,6-dideoxygalactose transaminase